MEEAMDCEPSYPRPNFWHTSPMATDVINPGKPLTGGALMSDPYPSPPMGVHHVSTSRPTGSNVVSTSGVLCAVCSDQAAGRYFGAQICEACKSFFIRSTKKGQPNFRCINNQRCEVTPTSRLLCQYCRYQKCLEAGMCRKAKQPAKEPSPDRLPCKVCSDASSGIHFGVYTCEGCKGFFRRSLKDGTNYSCSGKDPNACNITPTTRNSCRRCRFHKCLSVGMSRAGIKLGRHQKYLTGPHSLSDGDPTLHSAPSPAPYLNPPSNRYLPNTMAKSPVPVELTQTQGTIDNMESTYAQMNNYDARKDYGYNNFQMSGDMVHGVSNGIGYPPHTMGNHGNHVEINLDRQQASKMAAHSYHDSEFTGDQHHPVMTSPLPLTSAPSPLTSAPIPLTSAPLPLTSNMYSPKSQSIDMRPMDLLTYAMLTTIGSPQTTRFLELLNSSPAYPMPDESTMKSSNTMYPHPVMSNMMTSVAPPTKAYDTPISPSAMANLLQRKPDPQQQIKLEQQYSSCESGQSPSTNTPPMKSSNVVSSTSIDNGNQGPKSPSPVSSCPSSPFSEYEGDNNDDNENVNSSLANGLEINPHQSGVGSVSENYMPTQSGNNASHVTTSGSSLLMGNHWTSLSRELQDIKPEPPINTNKLQDSTPNKDPLPQINFKLDVNSGDNNGGQMANSEESRKRKSSRNKQRELENQMPVLGQGYLASLQQRLKMGSQNGEVLSVESESCLRQIQEPISDLDRGSIMFELSHAYAALLTKLEQINQVPERGNNQDPKMSDSEKEFTEIWSAKIVTMVTFVKGIPGFRALGIKDQMILIRFGIFLNFMVTFGTDPDNEGHWFTLHFLNPKQSWHLVAKGMEKYVMGCFEHFKQVKMDRIQIPLLMALVVFNPDLPSLVSRELIIKRHHTLRQILRQYCIEKYGNLSQYYSILGLVPDLFHVEYHHKQSVQQGIAFMSDVALPALFAEINL